MMQQVEEQFDDNEELHVVGCKDDDDQIQMQIMMKKGKRTKRRRQTQSLSSPPSPLRLSISISSDAGTTSSNIDHQQLLFINKNSHFKEEDNDLANCLILLAQDHKSTPMAAATAPNSELPGTRYNFDFLANNKKIGSSGLKLYLYECKTCHRYFPSYQALGGHKVSSHKKLPKPNHTTQQNKAVTTTNDNYYDPTNTNLTLKLSSSSTSSSNSSKRSRTTMTSTNSSSSVAKSKVHECSICGTQFASGQALGGHMRRHRDTNNNNNNNKSSLSMISNGSPQQPKNVLKLDLNLPAPEDDNIYSNFPFETKEKVRVFSAASLVDCHY